jgi:aminoglycoside phosphotransferase (APT) family kinase protein
VVATLGDDLDRADDAPRAADDCPVERVHHNHLVKKPDITPEVVATLVAAQFPQWADLPVAPVALDGWDNTTFRLGDDLSVRLPSADGYVPQIEKEHRWLPVLARALPLPIPEPVAVGRPTQTFPRPWSIYRWIDGEHATLDRIADLDEFAVDLGRFLRALYAIDTVEGPRAGAHSFHRGGSVDVWDEQTRASIEMLADEIDREPATEVWEAALASHWHGAPVWVHGDVAPSNLLVEEGRLSAVIDFGCSAVGDPACDLVIAWTFFSGNSSAAFRQTVELDDATWARGRGWALWKAVINLANERRGGPSADAGARRAGWSQNTHAVIDAVIADHCDHVDRG